LALAVLRRMNIPFAKTSGIASLFCALLTILPSQLYGQGSGKEGVPVVEGKVCDFQDRAMVGAEVLLESANPGHALVSTTDPQGHFRFEGVSAGTYTLHAKLEGYQDRREGPFALHEHETKSIVLFLSKAPSPGPAKDSSSTIAFSDEPAFTVAGVTDTSALGGHASGPMMRSSNALSKEAAALARGGTSRPNAVAREPEHEGASREASIRAMLAREDAADLHFQLAEIEESEGRPLEAVQEYQRAAEMQPTEPHLFAWGAELLLHHAPEPASEVFIKGRRLYPRSARMLIGLGAARYAQSSKEQAEQIFLEACDLNPSDPTPYLFLGRLQATENNEPPGWMDRMKRFVSLHPGNAMAHYFYAVALTKQERSQENLVEVESQLNTAIKLDPHLGNAYLQLGILRTEREDFPGAVAAFQKAIETTALPDEAHYRLAQVYRRTGDTEKARQEAEQFRQISEQKSKVAERERHEVQEFVYTLRDPGAPPQTATPKPQ
jgi:tetratricopeptide (TPR) repeat protein